jgi:hypothetical protein
VGESYRYYHDALAAQAQTITDGRSSWPEASHTNSLPGKQKERELR